MQRKRNPHANLRYTHYQTYLPPDHQEALAEIARDRGIAEAAVVREAIGHYLGQASRPASEMARSRPGRGLWSPEALAAAAAAREEMIVRQRASLQPPSPPKRGLLQKLTRRG